jgi:hypothetical protein
VRQVPWRLGESIEASESTNRIKERVGGGAATQKGFARLIGRVRQRRRSE